VLRPALYVFCLSLFTEAAFAGAWLQPQGKGISVGSATAFTSDEYFDEAGARVSQATFRKYELQSYNEYGLSEHWTLGANLFFNRVTQSGTKNAGIADSEFFARRLLYQTDGMVISAQPLFKLPSDYADNTPPLGGSKSTDSELSILGGFHMPLISERDYLDMRAGYRIRSRGLSPQMRADVAYGIYLMQNLLVVPALRTVTSIHPDTNTVYREDGEQDYDLIKSELGLLYYMSDTHWLQFTVFQHNAGVLAGAGEGISIGIGNVF